MTHILEIIEDVYLTVKATRAPMIHEDDEYIVSGHWVAQMDRFVTPQNIKDFIRIEVERKEKP